MVGCIVETAFFPILSRHRDSPGIISSEGSHDFIQPGLFAKKWMFSPDSVNGINRVGARSSPVLRVVSCSRDGTIRSRLFARRFAAVKESDGGSPSLRRPAMLQFYMDGQRTPCLAAVSFRDGPARPLKLQDAAFRPTPTLCGRAGPTDRSIRRAVVGRPAGVPVCERRSRYSPL